MLSRCCIYLWVCLLVYLSGYKHSTEPANSYWWCPFEVPEVESLFEYDDSGVPIIEWVELLEINNKLLEEIEDD